MSIQYADDFIVPRSQKMKAFFASYKNKIKYVNVCSGRSCGKSTAAWPYTLEMCMAVPGFFAIIGRNEYSTIIDSTLTTVEKHVLKYPLDDPRQPFRLLGTRRRPSGIQFPNGSFISFVGLQYPGKIQGKEPDLFWIEEAVLLKDEEVWVMISGSSDRGVLKRDGKPFSQIICTMNPGSTHNWVHKLLHPENISDDLKQNAMWLDLTLADNPAYSDDGITLNGLGKDREKTLKRSHPAGMFYDRYVLNRWVDAEGAVFSITKDNILSKEDIIKRWGSFPENMQWKLYAGADWGASDPTVVLWAGQHKQTKDILVYREFRKVHSDVDEVPTAFNAFTHNENIRGIWTDHSELMEKILKRHGIRSMFAKKQAGSIMEGILIINAALRRAQNGQDGGLYLYDNLRCNNDAHPEAKNHKMNTIEELESMLFDTNKDKPKDGGDHGPDTLRYIFGGIFNKKPNYYVSSQDMAA